jgi:peptidoglycan/LPS O-acetylase OafA/YrhL
VIRRRVLLPFVFVAVVIAFALYRPAPCTALYVGTALYLLFTPAGLLAEWRLDKRFPLAFPVYFLALLAAGAVALAVPQIGQDYIEIEQGAGQIFRGGLPMSSRRLSYSISGASAGAVGRGGFVQRHTL